MSKPAPTMTIGWKDEILNILLKKKEPKWDIDSPSDHSICLYHHQHLVVSSANLLTFRFYSIISFSIFFWYFFSFLASSSVTPQCSFLSSALLLHFQIPDLFAFPTSLALGQLLYTAPLFVHFYQMMTVAFSVLVLILGATLSQRFGMFIAPRLLWGAGIPAVP